MGGSLPPAVLCVALGLALSFSLRSTPVMAIAVAALLATVMTFSGLPAGLANWILSGLWLSVLVTGLSVHLPKGLTRWQSLALAANAGCWTGATIATTGTPADLLVCLPLTLVAVPGAYLATTKGAIALKVVASWLIAVAILGVALPHAPTLLGYQPDHLE